MASKLAWNSPCWSMFLFGPKYKAVKASIKHLMTNVLRQDEFLWSGLSLVERVKSHVRLVRTGQCAALKFFKQRRCCIKRLAKLPKHVFLKSFHTVERVFALQLIWIRIYIVILIVYHCIVILTCIFLSYYRHVSLYPNVHIYLVS